MTQKTNTSPDAEAQEAASQVIDLRTDADAAATDWLHPFERLEAEVEELLSIYSQPHNRGQYDQRLISIARTQIELGFCALYKALGKHDAEYAEGSE